MAMGQLFFIAAASFSGLVVLGSGFEADGSLTDPVTFDLATHGQIPGDAWPNCVVLTLVTTAAAVALTRWGGVRATQVVLLARTVG